MVLRFDRFCRESHTQTLAQVFGSCWLDGKGAVSRRSQWHKTCCVLFLEGKNYSLQPVKRATDNSQSLTKRSIERMRETFGESITQLTNAISKFRETQKGLTVYRPIIISFEDMLFKNELVVRSCRCRIVVRHNSLNTASGLSLRDILRRCSCAERLHYMI